MNFKGDIDYREEGNCKYISMSHRDAVIERRIPLHIWNQIDPKLTEWHMGKLCIQMQMDLNMLCIAKGYALDVGGDGNKVGPGTPHVDEGKSKLEAMGSTDTHLSDNQRTAG